MALRAPFNDDVHQRKEKNDGRESSASAPVRLHAVFPVEIVCLEVHVALFENLSVYCARLDWTVGKKTRKTHPMRAPRAAKAVAFLIASCSLRSDDVEEPSSIERLIGSQ